jgi:hypothetical protein
MNSFQSTRNRDKNIMDEKTDTQKRALLPAEVQKLKATGMSHSEAFSTAYAAHPEWRATDPLGSRSRGRRADITNINDGTTAGGAERSAKIQELVAEYQKTHPGASYDAAFRAVLADPANAMLAASMILPQRAFKTVQENRGSGVNTPPPYRQPIPSAREMPNSPAERARRAVPQGE